MTSCSWKHEAKGKAGCMVMEATHAPRGAHTEVTD